jgi:serine/threonine protein kinase
MAVVYLARSSGARGFERQVALKLTHPHISDEVEFASLALEEARIAARIRHRNVVSILDVGEDPNGLFMVMDYVEGATFSQLLKAKPRISRAIGVRILLDALSGLHAAHELRGDDGALLGVVHRDFSPQNILVGLDGVAQLTDFGIAKAADRAGQTSTGVIKGKVAYMAPEQAVGAAVDRRADVWSAGIVTWELFAGHRLYPNGEGVATLVRLLREPPPRLRTVCPDVTPEIEEVVASALSHGPEGRTPSALAFARALGEACAAAGYTADHEAVAEFAREAAGSRLAARRARVQEVLKLRGRMDALAEQSIEVGATGSTTSEGISGISLMPPRGDRTLVETTTIPTGPPGDTTKTVATDSQMAPSRSRRTPHWALVLGGLAALGLCATWFTGRTGARPVEPPPVLAVSAAAPLPAALPPLPVAPAPEASSPSEVSPPPEASQEAPASPVDLVTVQANAPVTSLTINGRAIALAEPATSVTLERIPSERIVDAKVVAIAADGQRASAWLHPSSTSLMLDFSRRAAAPAPSAPHRARAGLAPSPYDR